MSERPTDPSIFRPLQVVVAVFLLLVVTGVAISAWLTVREQQMLARAAEELREKNAFQEAQRLIELKLMATALGGDAPSRKELAEQIDRLVELCPGRSEETLRHLRAFRQHVLEGVGDPASLETLAMFQEVGDLEERDKMRLLAEVQAETASHQRYELAAPVALLGLAAILLPITWWRIVRPLDDFGRQIGGLARGDFSPTPEDEVDELTLPLHRSFLKLAMRLQELEDSHRRREASLEEEVRTATAALLAQQRSLARAERLAATGELAASVAHEVRNPLAGIQMSLANVRAELTDHPDLAERIELVLGEVERLGRLVNELVDSSRHAPEPARKVDLAELVDELLALTRYQLPPDIQLESRVQHGLVCRLPAERLRQALLNLVLNASSAIGEVPGRIVLEARRDDDTLRVTVSDDGPGFPADVLEGGARTFVSTRAQGTGLGLAMVRRFTRDQGGSLELENLRSSGDRPGARVSLELPGVVSDDA